MRKSNSLLTSPSTFLSALLIICTSYLSPAMAADIAKGKTVFEENCAGCHMGGMKGWLSGAPELGETADWAKHLEKGMTALNANIIKGTDKHEPMGDCDSCTQQDIENAIGYIASESK